MNERQKVRVVKTNDRNVMTYNEIVEELEKVRDFYKEVNDILDTNNKKYDRAMKGI